MHNFDYFPSVRANGRTCTQNLFESVVGGPALRKLMRQIASAKDDDQRGALKRQLPLVTWQAHFPNGRRRNADAQPSGLFMVDIDHVDNPSELYKQKVEARIGELGIVAVHKTPSAQGLRIVARCYDGCSSIAECQQRVARALGVDIDTVCKDYARASFLVSKDYFYYIDKVALWGESAQAQNTPNNQIIKSSDKSKKSDHLITRLSAYSQRASDHPIIRESDYQAAPAAYLGIPYDEISRTWWRVHYDGKEPVKSNRNTLTFELACALRHITGGDADLLDSIIPCYDGFPADEKRQCIESALKQKVTRMPARLQVVLQNIRVRHADNRSVVDSIDEMEEQDELYYIRRVPAKALPMGVRDSLEGLAPTMHLPALVGIGPMIGALATDVQVQVNEDMSHLNLIAYIVGEAASGKSFMDKLYDLWMYDLITSDAAAHIIENEYLEQMRRKKNAREQPLNPHVLIRCQSLKTSNAQLITRLQQSQGKHLYSYTPEAGQLCENQGQTWSNLSVIMRSAYDNSKYDTDYKNIDSTGVVIPNVKWNITMCCTPDVLHKANKNVTDGPVTRLAIARTPDNTFMRRIAMPLRSDKACADIRRVARLVGMMRGELVLPRLQQQSDKWLETVRLDTLKNDDKVRARLRMRCAVTAMRYAACFMLCAYAEQLLRAIDDNRGTRAKWTEGCETAERYLQLHPDALADGVRAQQTDEMMTLFDVVADYLLDMLCFYFRDKLQAAYNASNYQAGGTVHGKENDSVFERLPNEFSLADAVEAKGSNTSTAAAKMMLKRWKEQGLIEKASHYVFRKCTPGLPTSEKMTPGGMRPQAQQQY